MSTEETSELNGDDVQSITIPENMGIDPTLREVLEHNRVEAISRHEALCKEVRELRTEVEKITIQMLKSGANSATVLAACHETMGYCKSIADQCLRQFGGATKVPSVPPMRDPMASVVELREDMQKDVKKKLQEVARTTLGPKVDATPDQLTAVLVPMFEQYLTQREEALRVRANMERLAAIDKAAADAKEQAEKSAAEAKAQAEKSAARAKEQAEAEVRHARAEREKFKKKLLYGSVVAFVTAVAAAAGTYSFGHLSGHDSGVSEERDRHQHEMQAPATTTPTK
jgi:hypothetical protein